MFPYGSQSLMILLCLFGLAETSSAQQNEKKGVSKEQPSTGPAAFATEVPAALSAASRRAFAEGAIYFIWPTRPGAVVATRGNVRIPLNYALRPGVADGPFATKLTIDAAVGGWGPAAPSHPPGVVPSRVATSLTLPGDASDAVGDKTGQWKAVGLIRQMTVFYRGNGEATVFLINKSDVSNKDAAPISNLLKLTITFAEGAPSPTKGQNTSQKGVHAENTKQPARTTLSGQIEETRTIVSAFDFTGTSDNSGLPNKVTISVKETGEILKVSEKSGLFQMTAPPAGAAIHPGEPVAMFNEKQFSKGQLVCASTPLVSAISKARVADSVDSPAATQEKGTAFFHDDGVRGVFGLASKAEVVGPDKKVVATLVLNKDPEALMQPFLSIEEKHYDQDGEVVFQANRKATKASGVFVQEDRVTGTRKANFICSWPTGLYGVRSVLGRGQPAAQSTVEQKEAVFRVPSPPQEQTTPKKGFNADSAKKAGENPRQHTVLFQFDYSGAFGMGPLGIPSSVSLSVLESKEAIVSAVATGNITTPNGPALKYRQTYHSSPVLETEVVVPLDLAVRSEERFQNTRVQFGYPKDSRGSFFGVASSAEVTDVKTNKILARYKLESKFEEVGQDGLLIVDETLLDSNGRTTFQAKLSVTTGSGRIVSRQVVSGISGQGFIRLWPTWKYGSVIPGGPGVTGEVRMQERAR